jgi:cell division protein FtsI/penicillin-binding protein 2
MSVKIKKEPIYLLAFLISIIVLFMIRPSHGKKIQLKSDILNQSDVVNLIKKIEFNQIKKKYYIDNKVITTNINYSLQKIVEKELKKKERYKRARPLEVIIRAIDPDNGNVILAANFVKNKPVNFTTQYPAASLFKIISAAGVIDMYGYNQNTNLYFNGASHTLYRSQLRNKKNRYTNRITLKNAFAKSVNPVFGKIGNILGEKNIYYYSNLFGFNENINSDFPSKSGKTKIIKRRYNLAEIASGFNRETIITPLFGSIISSTIVNNGKVYKPHIVKYITDINGNKLYESRPELHKEILRGRTLKVLRELMVKTVKAGTARKAFRKVRYDRMMKHLVIGGKTGSINNRKHNIKYDWFAGFAKDKKSKKSIAISVLVMHGKYIGNRSGEYAYLIIKNFFKGLNA